MAELPFSAGKEPFLSALSQHRTAVVQAPPGTGKTTLAPIYTREFLRDQQLSQFSSAGNQQDNSSQLPPRVLVTQPPMQSDPPAAEQTELMSTAQPARHAPLVTLLLQDGSSRTYLVQEGTNIIGRGTDVDFRLPDMGVSRRHAEVMWDGRDAVLVDLHSTNGTTVNDTDIENWLLADGDVIKVGHSYIEVRITGG